MAKKKEVVTYWGCFSTLVDAYHRAYKGHKPDSLLTKDKFLEALAAHTDHIEESISKLFLSGQLNDRTELSKTPVAYGTITYSNGKNHDDDRHEYYGLFVTANEDGYINWNTKEVKPVSEIPHWADVT